MKFWLLMLAVLPLTVWADKESNDPDVLARQGFAFLRQGNIPGAEECYSKGYKLKKITTSIISLAGDIALAKNDREQADYYYGRAIYFDPRDTTGYMHYMRMHQKTEPQLAVTKLQQLGRYRPDIGVDRLVAHVWYSGNKVKESLAAYDSVAIDSLSRDELVAYAMSAYLMKDFRKSLNVVAQGRRQWPGDLIFTRLAMYNHTELKEYDEALEAAWKFFHPQPSTLHAPSVTYTYLDYIYYGYVHNGLGKYELGIEQFNKALQLEGGDRTDVLLAISKAYQNIGRYEQAVSYYQQYMAKLNREEVSAYVVYELGRLYYAWGTAKDTTNHEGADSLEHKMTGAQAPSPASLAALKKADETFAEVARMRPDSYLGVYWQARTNVALDPETEKGLAKPYYQQVIEMTREKGGSQLLEAYKYLAYYYYVKKDKLSAQQYIDKILDVNPMDSYALRLSAVI